MTVGDSARPAGGLAAALKTLVGVMLAANQPMFVAEGPERTLLYSDPYAEILAAERPSAGRAILDVWHKIRADVVSIFAELYAGPGPHRRHRPRHAAQGLPGSRSRPKQDRGPALS